MVPDLDLKPHASIPKAEKPVLVRGVDTIQALQPTIGVVICYLQHETAGMYIGWLGRECEQGRVECRSQRRNTNDGQFAKATGPLEDCSSSRNCCRLTLGRRYSNFDSWERRCDLAGLYGFPDASCCCRHGKQRSWPQRIVSNFTCLKMKCASISVRHAACHADPSAELNPFLNPPQGDI